MKQLIKTALIALIPTVTVAIFAGLTVNIGLEGWFSDRVRQVVGASISAAEAYREDERAALSEDAIALAAYLEKPVKKRPDYPEMPPQGHLSEDLRLAVAEYMLGVRQ